MSEFNTAIANAKKVLIEAITPHLERLLDARPDYNEASHFMPGSPLGARLSVTVTRSANGYWREFGHASEAPGRAVPNAHTTLLRGPRHTPEVVLHEVLTRSGHISGRHYTRIEGETFPIPTI